MFNSIMLKVFNETLTTYKYVCSVSENVYVLLCSIALQATYYLQVKWYYRLQGLAFNIYYTKYVNHEMYGGIHKLLLFALGKVPTV